MGDTYNVTSGHWMNPRANSVYQLLPHMEPGLLVDVGAAAGGFTRIMSQQSPTSQILALEPFPGNWPYLDEAVAELKNVTVDKRAASDQSGRARLYVSQVVSGQEQGWGSKKGYSSSGKLVSDDDAHFANAFDVEAVRLDELLQNHVRFLKVDVQGGELAVLKGCAGLLGSRGIDFMWVEFSGELDLLLYLSDLGYASFDSQYLLIPRHEGVAPDEGWVVEGIKNLSNGRQAFIAWPREHPSSLANYCDWFASLRVNYVAQTDLTFVHRDFLGPYFSAVGGMLTRLGSA